jgi:broad specificity phosphatase PhoE
LTSSDSDDSAEIVDRDEAVEWERGNYAKLHTEETAAQRAPGDIEAAWARLTEPVPTRAEVEAAQEGNDKALQALAQRGMFFGNGNPNDQHSLLLGHQAVINGVRLETLVEWLLGDLDNEARRRFEMRLQGRYAEMVKTANDQADELLGRAAAQRLLQGVQGVDAAAIIRKLNNGGH